MRQISESPPVIDIYFLKSLQKLEEELFNETVMLGVRTLAIAIMLPLNIYVLAPSTEESKDAFTLYLQLILIQNSIELARSLYFYLAKFRSKSNIVKIAQHFKHCLYLEDMKAVSSEHEDMGANDQLLFFEMEQVWGLRVSSCFYDFQNMEKFNELSEETRAMREKMGNRSIRSALQSSMCCEKSISFLLGVTSACLLVYGVILNYQMPLTELQGTFLELYLASEIIIFKTKMSVILFIVALLPFILVIYLLCTCFCNKQQKVSMPNSTAITPEMMSKCSDCAICFMTYSEGQKVIPLKCSNMHVFHETCIKGWAKVKPNCPICRHQID